MRKLLWVISGLIILAGCSEEIMYKAENNSVFEQYYGDTTAVIVKSSYNCYEYTDGDITDIESYSANTLFMKKFDSANWKFVEILDQDPNLCTVEWDAEANKMYIQYSDSILLIKDLRNILNDSTAIFNPEEFTGVQDYIVTLPADTAFIDSLNNGRWYLNFEDWVNSL